VGPDQNIGQPTFGGMSQSHFDAENEMQDSKEL